MPPERAGTPPTEEERVARVVDAFRSRYGREPAGVWAAPGRVNLIGEHTDYNDGFVLPFALPHTTLVAAAPRTDGVLRLHSVDMPGDPVELSVAALRPGAPTGGLRWTAYPAGVVWALGADPGCGADVQVASTVPVGAGLSSSAALEVATAAAFGELHGLASDPVRLARLCQRAENAFVGMPCGIMDQMASACCTEGHVLHLDTRDLTVTQVPFDPAAAGLRLLVVDTRASHELADGQYARRRAGCEAGAAALGVTALRDVPYEELPAALARLPEPALRPLVRHVVTENHRVAQVVDRLTRGELREVGPLLTAGHASLRDDFRVSCPELDLAVDTALAAGALGARMTGGGFGGSAIALVADEAVGPVGEAVREAFRTAGYRAPRLFEALPSAGVRRLR